MRYAPRLTLLLMIGPVLAGLLGTLAPAFGILPALGGTELSLEPWRDLFATPGIGTSIRLSLLTGLVATSIALALSTLIVAALSGTQSFRWVRRTLSPLLSLPHAAAAFGLAFLIAPSGWMARFFSPWLTGWSRPPDWLIVNDPAGVTLIAGLVLKEVPFLLLMILAALPQANPVAAGRIATSLGYGQVSGWMKCVFPLVWPQLRLPVYAVLAFSMSVVDVAIILGPTTPPPLSVLILEWMRDADLSLWYRAAAGAVLQTILVLLAVGLFWLVERWIVRWGRGWIFRGHRTYVDGLLRHLATFTALGIVLSITLGMAGLVVWSLAKFWSFPEFMPSGLTARHWLKAAGGFQGPLINTFVIAGSACFVALTLVIGTLEAQSRAGLKANPHSWILYLPLIIPQTGFLFGLQIAALILNLPRNVWSVTFVHLVFVLPYVFLALHGAYHAWDKRYATLGGSLGASAAGVLLRLRLPMLLAPVLTAFAIGLAVSIGQYLPTLLIGAGRVETLTTEAVALSSGGNRRLIGVYALLQVAAILPGFLLALLLPALVYRKRRLMRGDE